jgi:competence protein ComEC
VKVKDRLVAISQHPSALADDCAAAQVLILRWPRTEGCAAMGPVIDLFDLRYQGTHAIYLREDNTVRVETVGAVRGLRPWSMIHRRPAAPAVLTAEAIARVKAFAAPPGFADGLARPRPEVEDDESGAAEPHEEP